MDNKQANILKYENSQERAKFSSQPNKILKVALWKKLCHRLVENGEKILDIGGGAGIWTDVLREEKITDKISAVDISPDILRERNPLDDIRVGDMEKLPFENKIFDIAMFFASLHHVKSTLNALNEAKRVTKQNGSIILFEPVSLKMLLQNRDIKPTPDGVEYAFSKKYLFANIKKAGLNIEYIYFDGFFKQLMPKNNYFLLKIAGKTEEVFNNIPIINHFFGIFANSILVKARNI